MMKKHFSEVFVSAKLKAKKYIKDPKILIHICTALKKTIKGKSVLSPAILPLIVFENLPKTNSLHQQIAVDLSAICTFFHTAADLVDDVQDNDQNNPVINQVGKEQAINLSNLLLFISQKLIFDLDIDLCVKNKLSNLFLDTGLKMSIGQYFDIANTNSTGVESFNLVHQNKSGEEVSCFISCFPLVLQENVEIYQTLGKAYGELMQVFSDYFDIWGKENSDDLICLKNSMPLYNAWQDKSFEGKIRELISGKNDLLIKQFELRRVLSKTKCVEAFEHFILEKEKIIIDCFTNISNQNKLKIMITDLLENSKLLVETLYELRKTVCQTDLKNIISKNRSKNNGLNLVKKMALDYLTDFDLSFRDTWEVQRWGFLDEKKLIGNLFTPSLILETLHENGLDITSEVKRLIKLKNNNGWNYYTNTDKIPTDTDDLAQILNLISRTKLKNQFLEELKKPLLILEKNIEKSGFCPTWLTDDIHTRESINNFWYGDECIAVMANLYYGLLLFASKKYEKIISKGIDYITKKIKFKSKYYKSKYYDYYMISRLISTFNDSYGQKIFTFEPIKEQIIKEQKLNGSWNNSPQDTSFAVLSLVYQEDIPEITYFTAKKFLADTQKYDGSWDGEDLFLCPGKDHRFVYYKNDKVTTSFCFRALLKIDNKHSFTNNSFKKEAYSVI